MKSRISLLNIKGSIALLTLLVGTAAFALIPTNTKKLTEPAAAESGAGHTTFTSVLKGRGSNLPLFGLSDASVTTDKGDYSPGEVVHITGFGFGPGETVVLEVAYKTTGIPVPYRSASSNYASGHSPWYVSADGGGNFTTDWLVEEDSLNQTLILTADGGTSGLHAEVTFTDASIGTYDQCSNDLGVGYTTGTDLGCRWINGNLNANNSTYHEGDSTVQRAWLTGFTPGSSHTITFSYGTTKGGKHAYDYLTTWDFSENWITLADRCQDITGCTTATEAQFTIPDDPNVTNTIEPIGGATRQMTIRGGTITAVSTPTITSGTYTADSETQVTVTFTAASSGSMCGAQGCDVALFFGAHIARTDQWTPFNNTTGATTIPGSPYHVALAAIDGGSVGNRDNQMQANAIVPPTGGITITKLTIGGFGAFGFTASPTPSPIPGAFTLTTTAQTNPQSTSFTNVPAGTYRVTESSLPAGWSLNSLVCTGDTNNNNVYNLASHYVDIVLDNAEGQNCTFTNILPDARIVLSPITADNEIGTPHTITATVTQNDQLTAGAPGGDGTTGLGPVPDGTLVTFSLLNNTAGATFVSGNTCTTSGGTGTCSVQITSSTAGGVDVHATTTFSVLGVSLTRASGDGISGDGVNSHKNYVSGTVAIAANGVNEVNHQHIFTITATQVPAGATPATTANITVTPNPAPSSSSTTCGTAVPFVGNVATCTYTINNTSAGVFTVNASASFVIGSVTINRTTNGTGGNSGPATKRFVDARLSLTPGTATNPVGQQHVITATVLIDDGFAANTGGGDAVTGFGPAPAGVLVNTSLLNNTANATYVGSSSCTTVAGGTCTVTINSTQAGGVDIHGTTTLSVGGVSLTRATGDGISGDSANAHKDYVAGSLTLVKKIVNDNGGTAVVTAFGITTDAGAISFGAPVESPAGTFTYTSNTLTNLAPGTKSLHEGTLAGYSEGNWSCTGAAGTVVGNPQTGSVVIAANENVTCTIINNDIAPTLQLNKHVINNNGGTANASAWTLTATGSGGFSGTGLPATGVDASIGPNNVTAGIQYTLSESGGPSGYSSTGVWSCTGTGTFASPNKITLAVGQTASCTITNDDIAPTLQLNKHVINNNGGTANASAWTLTATGSGGFSGNGAPATGVDASIGPNNVTAGIQYALGESGGPSGYSTTGVWSCTGTGSFTSPNLITLAAGQTASCTITNDDIAPTLQLNKHVINNNGGTANASAWTLTATGSGGFSGAGAPATGTDASIGPNGVTAGVQYALSESGGPSGYSTTGIWSCTGAGTFVSPNLITLAVGQTASCTITNDDIAPTLQLNKHVINDNGGTANASAWTLTATGTGGFSGTGLPATGADAHIGPNNVNAGVQYALTESGGPSGYSTTGIWSCTGTGTFVSPNLITLAVGQTASCTITNDDIAPQLTLNKHVINNNGGTANASAWTLTATGSGGFSGAGSPATGPDASNGPNNVTAGVQYTLSESAGPSGYSSNGIWSCTGTGSFVSPNKITLAVGQTASCTITNDDIAPQLTLNKHVINDNGGTANASAWTLTATGSGGFSGAGSPATGVDASNGPNNVTANVQYALSESGGPGGYSSTGVWSCTGAGVFVAPNLITLSPGQTASCTITNDDIPGTIIIRKVTDPLNDPTSFSFDAMGTNYDDFSLTGVSTGTPPPNENAQQLNAGTYSVKEINIPANWVLTGVGSPGSASCERIVSGAGTSTGIGDTPTATATITLAIGDTIRCTFENTKMASVTRTQGFWATHPDIAEVAWFGGDWNGTHFAGVANTPGIGDTMLCSKNIDSVEKLLGGFWSNIPFDCNDIRRSSLDKARMTLLQQLLAAELNASAFGSNPIGGSAKFAQWEAAYCGTNTTAINTAKSEAAAFNEAGDSGLFTPGTSAHAKQARGEADTCFWNNTTVDMFSIVNLKAPGDTLIEKP